MDLAALGATGSKEDAPDAGAVPRAAPPANTATVAEPAAPADASTCAPIATLEAGRPEIEQANRRFEERLIDGIQRNMDSGAAVGVAVEAVSREGSADCILAFVAAVEDLEAAGTLMAHDAGKIDVAPSAEWHLSAATAPPP